MRGAAVGWEGKKEKKERERIEPTNTKSGASWPTKCGYNTTHNKHISRWREKKLHMRAITAPSKGETSNDEARSLERGPRPCPTRW